VPPETRYARVGPDRLAYQVLGQGPPDLVLAMGAFSHVDIVWEDPRTALFLRRLASFCRLLRFDRRGTGASDPLPPDPLPPWEAYAEELVAVMDAVGSLGRSPAHGWCAPSCGRCWRSTCVPSCR
jgi:pimeloyl-ACP methyl ester carboxylesterase